jgi:hypothetical protein
MIAVVIAQSVVLVVLCVLVAGLLNAYADVLRRLHRLDGGIGGTGAQASGAPPFVTAPGVPGPTPVTVEGRDEWSAGHDLAGVTPYGEVVTVRTVGVEHDTVIAFLSSGCSGCQVYWNELAAAGGWTPPPNSRVVVVTKGPGDESPAAVAALGGPGVDVLMSSQAWDDYDVPGSPYVVVVDGRAGRVKGMGSGSSLSQLSSLLGVATGDGNGRIRKPAAEARREAEIDATLRAAGIVPGHPSLYGSSQS